MRVLILGGTRFLGMRVAKRLLEEGAEVALFHRGVTGEDVPGTHFIAGDRADRESLERAGAFQPQVVIDVSSYFAEWTTLSLHTFANRVDQYIYVSSQAIYAPQPELPWPESTPFGPNPRWGQYGREKLDSELMLWEAHRSGAFSLTTFRYPFILGPANFVDREAFVLSRIQAGQPLLLAGGGKAINQFVSVRDAAEAIVTAVMQPAAAAGYAFNCAFSRGLTNRGFVDLCASVLGIEAYTVAIDEHELGVYSPVVELPNLIFPFPNFHSMVDPTLLTSRLGFVARDTPRRMIEEFVDWWKTQEDHGLRPYERETQALLALRERGGGPDAPA